jgi:hypothetical protein
VAMATEAPPRLSDSGGEPGVEPEVGVESSVPFPRYSVALVQNESEMLQAPSYDLHIFLEQDPVFDVELFTERSFHALPGESARFDCVVIGYNAAHKSGLIRKALEDQPPATGLCVLHQLAQDGLSFLRDDVGAELKVLDGAADRVQVARGRDPDDEILLNWPAPVALEQRVLEGATVYCRVDPGPQSNWRTVLEIEHGDRLHPVLLRTPTHRGGHPVVICTALLSQARPNHAALLKNILTWCVGGRPDVVVLQAPHEERAAALHRKLRLQGSKAIADQVEPGGRLGPEGLGDRGRSVPPGRVAQARRPDHEHRGRRQPRDPPRRLRRAVGGPPVGRLVHGRAAGHLAR